MSEDMLQSVLRTLLQVADRTLDAAHSMSNGVLSAPGVAPAARRAYSLADQFGDLAVTLGDQFTDVADQWGERVGDFGGFTSAMQDAVQDAVPDHIGDRAAAVSSAAAELVAALSSNRAMVEDVIRAEIESRLRRVGLASENELAAALADADRLRADNARLQRALALHGKSEAPQPPRDKSVDSKPSRPGAPTRPVTSRAALRETTARQAALTAEHPSLDDSAKKAPAKKAVTKKAVTKKTPAKKAVARKTPAKKAVAKKSPAAQAAPRKAPVKRATERSRASAAVTGNPN